MNRMGQDNSWKSAMKPISSPSVIWPLATRADPTASSRMIAIVGKASSAASKVALIVPPRTRASRRASACSYSRRVSASSRPSVFTTRAPSIDSWATALTSPMRSCAVWAGSSIRRAKIRFITASEGKAMSPTSASHGSVSSNATRASTVSRITPTANGTGQNTSTAAFTSASMCARSSPVGVSRWYWSESARYRSATRVRSVAMTRSPATPE